MLTHQNTNRAILLNISNLMGIGALAWLDRIRHIEDGSL